MGSGPLSDAAGIFAKADISPMMDAVFDACPVIADRAMELVLGILLEIGTGYVIMDLVAGFIGTAERNAFASQGDYLPAAAQADFFGSDTLDLDAAAHQASVFLLPVRLLRGKK